MSIYVFLLGSILVKLTITLKYYIFPYGIMVLVELDTQVYSLLRLTTRNQLRYIYGIF